MHRRDLILRALKPELDGLSYYYEDDALDAPVVAFFKNPDTHEAELIGYNSMAQLEEEYNREFGSFAENGLLLTRLFIGGREAKFSVRVKVEVIKVLNPEEYCHA